MIRGVIPKKGIGTGLGNNKFPKFWVNGNETGWMFCMFVFAAGLLRVTDGRESH